MDKRNASEEAAVEPSEAAGAGLPSQRKGHPYLLAEAEHVTGLIAGLSATVKYLCITVGAITFSVVSLTGSFVGSGFDVGGRYAWFSSGSVVAGALAALGGILAFSKYEDVVEQGKYLRIHFEFGDREQIELAKLQLDKLRGQFWFRHGVPVVAGLTALNGVFALLAYFEAVF